MPEIRLQLPRLHAAQLDIKRNARRFNTICCGRRFGKSILGEEFLISPALQGRFPVAWFSPTYKMMGEIWRDVKRILAPIIAAKDEQEKRIELLTGGVLDFWSLDNYDAIRGRKYKRIVADEVAVVGHFGDAWNFVLRPLLTDFKGDAFFLSTPKGMNFFHEAFSRGVDPLQPDWASWQMPTTANPFIDPAEVEDARGMLPDRVFEQEYLAQFLEDGGGVFSGVSRVVLSGQSENIEPAKGRLYSAGVDLARVNDFTVICVCDEAGRQVYFERFNQISWERQIEAIKRVALKYDCAITLDSTGVGDPIYERLRKAGLRVTGFHFSNQSKEQLIDNLAVIIEAGECSLLDLPEQTSELRAYQYALTKSRRVTMNAPEGMHDDCVIALALSMWGRKRNKKIVADVF